MTMITSLFSLIWYDIWYIVTLTGNIGFSERLLEGDSTELECPVSDVDTGDVIWVSPDGQKIDADSTDKR